MVKHYHIWQFWNSLLSSRSNNDKTEIAVKNRTLTSAILITTSVLLSACAPVLPVLEGGQVTMVHGIEETPALEELSKIDLIYELDPGKHGFCHPMSREDELSMTAPTRLKCALDGFYSHKYFEELDAQERSALEVSNVAFAYAEKQARRVRDLAKEFAQNVAATDQGFYQRTELRIQNEVVNAQIEDLIGRVAMAQRNASYLEYQRRQRNHVQSIVMTASDAACDLYKRNLNSIFSNSNFIFGSAATFTGGLGAILTNTDTVRALSGTSGIISGVRAEFNDAYFRNKVVELLTKAMDIAAQRKREEIRRRSVQIIADYSMEDALDDAVLYNAKCSLVAGLQETSESLQIVSDPGLKWLANAFGGAASNQELTQSLFESLGQAVSTVQQIQKSTEDSNAVIAPPDDEEEGDDESGE